MNCNPMALTGSAIVAVPAVPVNIPTPGTHALVDAARRVGPVAGNVVPVLCAAVDDAVAAGIGTVPELCGNAILNRDEIDLAGDDGLDLARRKAARDAADRRASRKALRCN